ncbi:MAG: variant repeat protein [Bacteroidota bacterium]|jgi:hypothetical protein|nr:variant repeat protein [Bacteroidota bacterium]
MNKLFIFATLTLLTVLFSKCKNTTNTGIDSIKTDSLAQSKNHNPAKVSGELGKYSIVPPDADYTGDYIDKYPNGVIKFSGFFRFGKRHGEWMAFYENGLKWSDCFYDQGKKHGATTVFHPNGKTFYTGWYKNDLKDSLWLFYDSLGKEVDRRAYRNDIETGLVY